MFKLLRNRKGVTLVEVLAVIVILGIIAAIAVPTIGNLIENQRENAAETEWANIQEAARLYATTEEPAADFDLDTLIASDYLSDFDGEIVIYTTAGNPSQTIEENTSILFDKTTGEIADSITVEAVTIDGYLAEGTIPTT